MTTTQDKNSTQHPRDYRELERRLRRCHAQVFGRAKGYALYSVVLTPSRQPHSAPHLLVSAGIHGDEPAGVEAALQLIESRPQWAGKMRVTVFPCLNPSGYELGTRTDSHGNDLNRQFRAAHPPAEITAYLRSLANQRFNLTIALHEDYDGTGFYLYELCHQGAEFGDDIIKAIHRQEILPVDRRRRIENRPNLGGVIHRDPIRHRLVGRKRWPEAIYLFDRHASHTLTTETPSDYPMAARVRAQLTAIRVAAATLKP